MRFAFDLSQYIDVKDNAENIYQRLQDQSMPCDEPWSSQQLGLFRQWIDAGCEP